MLLFNRINGKITYCFKEDLNRADFMNQPKREKSPKIYRIIYIRIIQTLK